MPKEIKSKITKEQIDTWKKFIAEKKKAPTIIVIDKTQTIVHRESMSANDRAFFLLMAIILIFSIFLLTV